MKTLLTFVAFLSVSVSAAFAQSKTEDQIKVLSQKCVQWLLTRNVDSLKNLYDPNSITIHSNGMMRTGTDHLEDLKNGRPLYKSIDVKESSVKEFGDTAVLVGKGLFDITIDKQDMKYDMIYTEVYKKTGGQWKLIARQAVQQN